MNNLNLTDKNETIMTPWITILMAFACGSIVANLYYTQILVPVISIHLQLSLSAASFVVTLTQIGYGTGLLFLVPLADLIENRMLITVLLIAIFICLLGIIFSNTSAPFLSFCFLLGLTTVAAQVIIPFVAHLSSFESRGKTVGNVMSGLLFGIMLSRPMASLFTDLFSWKAIFIVSSILMLILIFLLRSILPKRMPEHQFSYGKLLSSMPNILKDNPVLQRRAIYQAMLFGVFSLFWTSIAMLLTGDFYHYSQAKIALFAFAGATGALTAPIAGRLADKGFTRAATAIAIILVGASFLIAKLNAGHSIVSLIIAALLLDIGVSCNLVLGQRAIFSLAPEIRGRLNGLYMAIFFMGGAIGSAVAGYLYSHGGWNYVTNTGLIIFLFTFIYYLTEYVGMSKE